MSGHPQSDLARPPHFDVATKRGDPRHQWFTRNRGRRCWELDAMNPNDLRNRVRRAITSRIDKATWNRAREIEAAEIESMQDFHTAWRERLESGGS